MLIFDAGRESEILPAFADLIRKYRLNEIEEPCFKAVGWVGKDKTDEDKVCLRYYHPEYQKALGRKSRWFGTLLSYANAKDMSLRDDPLNVRSLFDIALGGVVHSLRLTGLINPKTQRPFTATTLDHHLKEINGKLYAILRLSLAEWLLAFCQNKMTVCQMRDAMSEFLRIHFVGDNANLKDFLESDLVDFAPPQKDCSNTFISDSGDMIKVGTVHSIKGETHTATLYLETFYYELDLKRLLPFCLGEYPVTDAKKPRHCSNLKVAHVAFSHPTHLLAFACCSENLAGKEKELADVGWVVLKI